MRKIILPVLSLLLLFMGACNEEIDYEALLTNVSIKDVTAVREGDKIMVTWAVPNYEHMAGFVATDDYTSSSIDVAYVAGEATASCEFDATPGTHIIQVQVKDTQGNLSGVTTVEIYINNVGDVYNLVKLTADLSYDVYKNGEDMNLGLNLAGVTIKDMIVAGQDVYIAGYRKNEFNKDEAIYFKNGEAPVVLATSDTEIYKAYGIVVNGEDVYVFGSQGTKASTTVVVWKNGAMTEYSDMAYQVMSNRAIAVSGSDVYVAFNTLDISVSPYKLSLNVSKNGTVTTLAQYDYPSAEAQAIEGINVSGDDVYVLATMGYFKNGDFTALNSTATSVAADNIVVSASGDVYVSGTENNGSINQPRYWKNGEVVELSAQSVNKAVYIAEYNGDVYVSGVIADDTKGYDIILNWKNGTEEVVYDLADSFCYGMAVSERPL